MRLTRIIVGIGLALGGCGKSAGPSSAGGTSAGSGWIASALPQVAVASATLVPTGKPPELILVVDDGGAIRLAAAPSSWAALGAAQPRPNAQPLHPDVADKVIREAEGLGVDGEHALEWLPKPGDPQLDDVALPLPTEDDPPPPEPDDGEDESGGTGTAMALEEGKMGKLDSDRAEGQYKMQKPGDADKQRAAREAERIAVRKRGVCGGAFAAGFDDHGNAIGGWGDPSRSELRRPHRRCEQIGTIAADPAAVAPYTVLMASPRARAAAVVPLLENAGAIAVAHQGAVRLLRVVFDRKLRRDQSEISRDAPRWIEVRLTAAGLEVEAVPDQPIAIAWTGGALDAAAVAKAYDQAVAARQLDHAYSVDVLVRAETTMQQLVDVLAALDAAGATAFGVGTAPAPGDAEAGRRGHRVPLAETGNVSVVGDLDRSQVQRAMLARLDAIEACYAALVATTPAAAGDVTVQLTIDKAGTARKLTATGVDPAVAKCIADDLRAVKFPAPSSGTAQVSLTLTLSN